VSLSPRFWRARFSAGGVDYSCVGFYSGFPPGKANIAFRDGNLFFDLFRDLAKMRQRSSRYRRKSGQFNSRIPFRHFPRWTAIRNSLGNLIVSARFWRIRAGEQSEPLPGRAVYAARATLAQSTAF